VSFQLEAVAALIGARTDKWTDLGLACDTRPISPNHGKPVVVADFRSAAWLVEILVWDTGEAEVGTIRVTDGRIVNKHHDLAGADDLERLLDELVLLLANDRIPASAVVAQLPSASA
jgi:hypothetical protein